MDNVDYCGLDKREASIVHSIMTSKASCGVIEKLVDKMVADQKALCFDEKKVKDEVYDEAFAFADASRQFFGVLQRIAQTYQKEVQNAAE